MTTTPKVPLLRTPDEVADWLDASHPLDDNFAAFNQIHDHLGDDHQAMRLWHDGAQLVAGRRHPSDPRAGA